MPLSHRILVVDDDPSHLEIYGLILKRAGFTPVSALAGRRGIDLPAEGSVDLILLDYKLNSTMTSVEAAQMLGGTYPGAPIVLLSDVFGVPIDIAPYVAEFVRKGEPAKLVAVLARMLPLESSGVQVT